VHFFIFVFASHFVVLSQNCMREEKKYLSANKQTTTAYSMWVINGFLPRRLRTDSKHAFTAVFENIKQSTSSLCTVYTQCFALFLVSFTHRLDRRAVRNPFTHSLQRSMHSLHTAVKATGLVLTACHPPICYVRLFVSISIEWWCIQAITIAWRIHVRNNSRLRSQS
jgi:hypothetical protein